MRRPRSSSISSDEEGQEGESGMILLDDSEEAEEAGSGSSTSTLIPDSTDDQEGGGEAAYSGDEFTIFDREPDDGEDGDSEVVVHVEADQQQVLRSIRAPSSGRTLDITIETLLGTSYEVRVSNKTNVGFLKAKLQRHDGTILNLAGFKQGHRHFQYLHLLHRGRELPDDLSLRECGVCDGSTIKLVLTMRGGPINTRRVLVRSSANGQQPLSQDQSTIPSHVLKMMEQNREKIRERIPNADQVTVLVFRDGDRVNLYHVLEKPDGSLSPIGSGWLSANSSAKTARSGSGSSVRSHLTSAKARDKREREYRRLKENAVTMTKVSNLKLQMEKLAMRRDKSPAKTRMEPKGSKVMAQKKGPHPKSWSESSDPRGRKIKSDFSQSLSSNWTRTGAQKLAQSHGAFKRQTSTLSHSSVPLPPIARSEEFNLNSQSDEAEFCSIQPLLGNPQITKPTSAQSMRAMGTTKTIKRHPRPLPTLNSTKRTNMAQETKSRSNKDYFKEGFVKHRTAKSHPEVDVVNVKIQNEESFDIVSHCKTQRLISADISTLGRDSQAIKGRRKTTGHPVTSGGGSGRLLAKRAQRSPRCSTPLVRAKSGGKSRKSSAGKNRPVYVANSLANSGLSSPKTVAKKAAGPRCRAAKCRKKLNITNTFSCRCSSELVFCAKHRHPESHECTFDFKTEGRKYLEEANPLLVIPKLPKI